MAQREDGYGELIVFYQGTQFRPTFKSQKPPLTLYMNQTKKRLNNYKYLLIWSQCGIECPKIPLRAMRMKAFWKIKDQILKHIFA